MKNWVKDWKLRLGTRFVVASDWSRGSSIGFAALRFFPADSSQRHIHKVTLIFKNFQNKMSELCKKSWDPGWVWLKESEVDWRWRNERGWGKHSLGATLYAWQDGTFRENPSFPRYGVVLKCVCLTWTPAADSSVSGSQSRLDRGKILYTQKYL